MIEIAGVSHSAGLQAIARARQGWGLDAYAACLFVSGNAVTYFFKSKAADTSALVMPAAVRCLAPGPATAAALMACGVPVGQIDSPLPESAQFDSEALWQVIGQRDWVGQKVLIVRGQSDSAGIDSDSSAGSGREWISRQWLDAGAAVEAVSVYQRKVPVLDEAQLARVRLAAADGSIWLFSSSEAVANLMAISRAQGLDLSDGQAQGWDWSGARAVVTHPRIAEAAKAAGWATVVMCRPALADIAAAAQTLSCGL